MDGAARTLSSHYDPAGNRTILSGDSGYNAAFDHDGLGRMTAYRGVVSIGYDKAGRRSSLGMGAGGATSSALYAYDEAGRLAGLTRELAGSANDLGLAFKYNPASQIGEERRSNDSYAWTGSVAVDRPYSVNGQNQYLAAGPATFAYDRNGNLVSDGTTDFVYDAENRLVSASGAKSATLSYDPLGRLWQVTGGGGAATRFLYDGDRLVMEYGGSGNVLRSYVHGPGVDEPLAWYEASAGWTVRYLHADSRGSIVAVADANGNPVTINAYDEYGIPGAENQGRFQYTGQAWLPELGMYYYKARFYSPTLGRFLQTDPIGYDDQINLYAYVGNDPINKVDPTGKIVETVWDVISLVFGGISLGYNLSSGNYGGAAADAGGIIFDMAATAIPGMPGGAGAAIAAYRLGRASSSLVNSASRMAKIAGARSDIASAASSIQNNVRDHLRASDVAGAVGDILGNPIGKRGGGSYQHLKEVTDALRGLKNSMDTMRKALSAPGLSRAERQAITRTLGETAAHKDRIEKVLDTARSMSRD